jgi:putative ABC transport system ATP-binding protein
MIVLEGISKVYDDGGRTVTALRDVSLRIDRGEFVAVVGPSGSGKSTLLQIIGCLDTPTSGTYQLDGIAVSSMDDATLSRLRNERIGFVFQAFNLIPRTTAVENVELPMCYGPASPVRSQAMAMLDRVGMAQRAEHFPSQLSGGEQQRVAIARALMLSPSLLIADEPTGNLDEATGAQILDLLSELHRAGLTIVLVTHDPAVARRAERVITLRDGAVVSDAPAAHPVPVTGGV